MITTVLVRIRGQGHQGGRDHRHIPQDHGLPRGAVEEDTFVVETVHRRHGREAETEAEAEAGGGGAPAIRAFQAIVAAEAGAEVAETGGQ